MAEITPAAMATDLANAYVSGAQKTLTAQSNKVKSTSAALTKLQSALSSFETALTALSGKKSMVQRSATVTGSAVTASAAASAQPGSYSLFVERIATRQQITFEDLPAVPVALGGPLVVKLQDGSDFRVELTMADRDGDGTISHAEIARAINLAENNSGKVTATTVTTGGQTQLILSAGTSGLGGQITLDTSGLPTSPLKTALDAGGRELVAARDALVWIGEKGTGIRIEQGSNTITSIPGVTLTLSQAMADGTPPITLTVANDDGGTAANVQSFVDAYNTLEKALDELTAYGKEGAASAAFASDAGIRALRTRIGNALRHEVSGANLMAFGIKTSRDGSISLDRAKLDKALAAKPEGLDALFGSAGLTSSSGVLGAVNDAVRTWTDRTSGQLKQRQSSVEITQKRLTGGQERIEAQYASAYKRYLAQFTQLQNLQEQMNSTSSFFSTMGSTS